MKAVNLLIVALALFAPAGMRAHCDGLDGPVVKAAQIALETGDVAAVLPWVQSSHEAEVRDVFAKTLAVRKVNAQARDLADRHFWETVVRLHRAGEGAPYTGLKPAGRDLGAAIPAADRAIAEGSAKELLALLTQAIQSGIHEQFHAVVERKDFSGVAAGREYVKAYVQFLHYVERVYEAARTGGAHAHAE